MRKVIIVLAGVAIILLVASYVQKSAKLSVVGVNVPVVVMRVGETESVEAYLLDKPRGTKKFNAVLGSIEFFRDKDFYHLTNPAESLGRTLIATSTPTLVARQSLQGLQPGKGELTISEDPAGPEDFKEAFVPVIVVSSDTGMMALIRIAARAAGTKWYHGAIGNFFPNFFGGQCKGLCDQWADWLKDWVVRHNNGDICKVEEVVFNVTGGGFRHVALRITLCETGRIWYLDGHNNPDSPLSPKNDYEAKRGVPEQAFTHWEQ